MRRLLTHATVIDGLGGVHERTSVGLDGTQIVAITPDDAAAKNYDEVLDLQGKYLLPGLIDTHLHFAGGDYDPATEHDAPGLASLRSIDAAQRSLLAGFTTIRSAGARDDLDIDARDAVNQGVTWGPRILTSGRGITHTGGHVHETAYEADGPDEVRKAARTLLKRGADCIKLLGISAGVATAGADVEAEGFSVEEIRAGVQEARRARKLNLTHSIGLQATKNAIEGGVASIDHGIFLDEEACQKMKDKGIYLVPTFGPFWYYTQRREAEPWRSARAERTLKPHRESFRMAMEMGVPIAMGSDLGAPSRMKNGQNGLELWLMVDAGMPAHQVLQCATSQAAKLLKLDRQIGSVEVGKLADLIVLGRNPIDDIKAVQDSVRLVMRDGVIYKNELEV